MKNAKVVKTKPMSINQAFQGRRYKTDKYRNYDKELAYKLPNIIIPKGKLKLKIKFYFSSTLSDIDNPVKLIIDAMQKKYSFNDRDIYELHLKKEIVKKGEERFSFKFYPYE